VIIYIFAGDNKLVEPGPLSEGFARYDASEMEHYVFEFLLNYVRRVKSDMEWKKLLKRNPEKPFLMFVTPSDIAFILSLIKNGMKMWDQAKGQEDNPTERESKAQPLFTKGEGQKRESGMSVWSNEGLNFYYTAEKNWKNVYNDNDEFSNMCNKWERWEPEDKSQKDPVRTYWRQNDEQKDDIEDVEEQNEPWWELEGNLGFGDESEGEPEICWDEDIKKSH